jgi:uncharacterized protein (DUF1697 family)
VGIYVALLRGINVGGSGLLAMKDLATLCSGCGLQSVRTYIQSGNVVVESGAAEKRVRADLEKALATKMAKKVDVMVRSAPELRDVLKGNPFPEKEPAKVAVAFLGEAPPKDLLKRVVAPGGELVKPGRREVYVYYPEGMGRSKLKLPLEGPATVRNVNTVAKLVAMMDEVKQA